MNYFEEIRRQAAATPDKEICGFLHLTPDCLTLNAVAKRNRALQPQLQFEISTEDYLEAVMAGTLFGHYHSHVGEDDEQPSAGDMAQFPAINLPALIYSVSTDRFSLWRPAQMVRTLHNRWFVEGIQDCAQLVMDWFQQENKVKFPFFPRPREMWSKGLVAFRPYLTRLGFVNVDKPEPGDMVVMSVNCPNNQANHVGVLQKDGLLLHHLFGQMSVRQTYSAEWQTRTVCGMRHL